jgi:hypothetical protein
MVGKNQVSCIVVKCIIVYLLTPDGVYTLTLSFIALFKTALPNGELTVISSIVGISVEISDDTNFTV